MIFDSSCLEALIRKSGRPSFRVPCNEAICGLQQHLRMHVHRPVCFAFCFHSKNSAVVTQDATEVGNTWVRNKIVCASINHRLSREFISVRQGYRHRNKVLNRSRITQLPHSGTVSNTLLLMSKPGTSGVVVVEANLSFSMQHVRHTKQQTLLSYKAIQDAADCRFLCFAYGTHPVATCTTEQLSSRRPLNATNGSMISRHGCRRSVRLSKFAHAGAALYTVP